MSPSKRKAVVLPAKGQSWLDSKESDVWRPCTVEAVERDGDRILVTVLRTVDLLVFERELGAFLKRYTLHPTTTPLACL